MSRNGEFASNAFAAPGFEAGARRGQSLERPAGRRPCWSRGAGGEAGEVDFGTVASHGGELFRLPMRPIGTLAPALEVEFLAARVRPSSAMAADVLVMSIRPTSMPWTRLPCGAPSWDRIFLCAMPAARDTAVGAPPDRGLWRRVEDVDDVAPFAPLRPSPSRAGT